MNMANALKPLLVDDRVRIIGATTPEEHRRYIEADRALARRFTEIRVPEPDRKSTLSILRNVAPRYEEFQGVRFPAEALEQIYDLAQIYLPNESFPAKAVDLLDELAVRVRMTSRKADEDEAPEPPMVRAEDVREAIRSRIGARDDSDPTALAAKLKSKVFGQDRAADLLADIVLRSRYRYGKERRRGPRSVVLFVGPPGVGKTYMAQALAAALRPGDGGLLTLDMTEFGGIHAGEHARWRLIGPPAPYVGWEAGGLMTNHAIRNPLSVILVDEFDKAGAEAQSVLLRVFDEGVIQDGRGRLVSFRETIFVLTSNRTGQRKIGLHADVGKRTAAPPSERELRDKLRTTGILPELLSRITSIVEFQQLQSNDLANIAKEMLENLQSAALSEDAVALQFPEDEIARWLLDRCGTPLDCRRLREEFERRIEMPLVRWRAAGGGRQKFLWIHPGEFEVELLRERAGEREAEVTPGIVDELGRRFGDREGKERARKTKRPT